MYIVPKHCMHNYIQNYFNLGDWNVVPGTIIIGVLSIGINKEMGTTIQCCPDYSFEFLDYGPSTVNSHSIGISAKWTVLLISYLLVHEQLSHAQTFTW